MTLGNMQRLGVRSIAVTSDLCHHQATVERGLRHARSLAAQLGGEIDMVPMTVRATGMAWYRLEDYRRILEIMEDADKLPATYDQWRLAAELGERNLKGQGHIVFRAMIDPKEFTIWCQERHLKLNAHARTTFAALEASRQAKDTH